MHICPGWGAYWRQQVPPPPLRVFLIQQMRIEKGDEALKHTKSH